MCPRGLVSQRRDLTLYRERGRERVREIGREEEREGKHRNAKRTCVFAKKKWLFGVFFWCMYGKRNREKVCECVCVQDTDLLGLVQRRGHLLTLSFGLLQLLHCRLTLLRKVEKSWSKVE